MLKEIDFDQLPKYQERSFVSDIVDLKDVNSVADLFTLLIERDIASAEELEQWLLDYSELSAVMDQQGSVLYIKMTCHTDSAQFVEDYKDFVQNVMPAIKPLADELNQKFLRFNQQFPLDANRYRVFERNLRADVELFSSENIPLETDVQLLSQEYQSLFGSIAVNFQDETHTLPKMAKFQQELDREVREQAWRATAERCRLESDRIEGIFDTMMGLRDSIARNAGFSNFMDYQFKSYHRFDYHPGHCKRYHDAVKKCVVPVWQKILERRRRQMKLDKLRPWDLSVDPLGRLPLKPFAKVEELVLGVHAIFNGIDPLLGGQFDDMAQHGLLDLESRKGKAPGGYQSTLAEMRKPFIFMNAVGIDSDVRTLLHEGGHAFHAFAAADEPVHDYRHAPMEFCEVASMSMELSGNQFLNRFYETPEDHQRSVTTHLEGIVHVLAWVANIDAFQQWMYQHPEHTREERHQKWEELYQMFNGTETDWMGLEHYRRILWHRQLHIFEVPFYYIEYGIAQLGALQIWLNAKNDQKGALEKYKKALALGGSRTLPELFATAGIKFSFSEKTITPLIDAVVKELKL